MCKVCNVLGDEKHALFDCAAVDRRSLVLPSSIGEIWNTEGVFELFERLSKTDILS